MEESFETERDRTDLGFVVRFCPGPSWEMWGKGVFSDLFLLVICPKIQFCAALFASSVFDSTINLRSENKQEKHKRTKRGERAVTRRTVDVVQYYDEHQRL